MRGLRRARRVVVADDDVFRLHAHFMRGDLRQHGEDALADFGDAGDDLGGAAIVDLGPGGGAVDGRGTGDPVPARRHAASASCACHDYSAALLFFDTGKARAQRARRTNVVAVQVFSSTAARDRRARLPAGGFFRRIERAHEADAAELLLGVGDGAVAHGVDAADRERIEA